MKKRLNLAAITICITMFAAAGNKIDQKSKLQNPATPFLDSVNTAVVLEPYTYSENFQSRDLGAWASYPLWQDNAYDANFQVGQMVPGDLNLSIVGKVTPYSNVDNYAGAQKLLDMYLVPEAKIRFRYFLKTNHSVQFLKVRFAAGKYGKIDYTINAPKTNQWTWVTLGFNDFATQNPIIREHNKLQIYALAFLVKIPNADPAMPIYLGLDDISFKGAIAVPFRFATPSMYKLPEFRPYIPRQPYYNGDSFKLSGDWLLNAKKVKIEISRYTAPEKILYSGALSREGNKWVLKPFKLSYPDGLYLAKLAAYNGSAKLSETEFTIHIAPKGIAGEHPRLLFNNDKKKLMEDRFKDTRFQAVLGDILDQAKIQREKVPVKSLEYDLDQFPDRDWLPSWSAFGSHIYDTGPAIESNSLAYAFQGDTLAGEYAKNILVKLAGWPTWVSPWLIKRGRFSEHRMGTWSHKVALAYDLTYNLMTADERGKVRKAIIEKIIKGVYRTYVYDNMVTSNTSNWIGHTVGGALMNMAAIYGDGAGTKDMEPYFTGSMMKFYAFITHVTCAKGGAYGEGYGYNSYTFSNFSYSVPSLYNVFNIDVTDPLVGSYNEYIWGGLIKDKKWFGYGDSEDSLLPATDWAFLLDKSKDPRLSWYYNYLKKEETFKDVLFDTKDVPQNSPFNENPDKIFPEIGTTVFKSGWGKDDFAFVMRTGAFYNHQHLDQGSFYLADKGVIFIEDHPMDQSTYYDDPIYQSNFIQPVSHSTIVINHNPQSQRVGDPLNFAPGFNDHASITQFLDSKGTAFSSGDIGRLYWGKVKSLTRNVLYIKPGTLLMLDIAKPAEKDVDVTLLYQTAHLKDIDAGQQISKITKDGFSLNIMHLAPQLVVSKAVETPHYLKTLLKEKPLVKEGMLTVTARTHGTPLVMANLLTTTPGGLAPDVVSNNGNGFVSGEVSGKKFAFTTKPGNIYHVDNMETDALAMTWGSEGAFVAMATIFKKEGGMLVKANKPITFELSADSLKYYISETGQLMIGALSKPSSVMLNGQLVKNFLYDKKNNLVIIKVLQGEGVIIIK
jgi:hypothetical protein